MDRSPEFTGIVEVDETLIGGIEKNKHSRKKLPSDRWVWHGQSDHLGKAIVVGAKERGSRRLKAKMVTGADRVNLRTFIRESVKLGTTLHTDHQPAYDRIPGYPRHAVNHSAKEYVRGNVHTNGIESAWAFLKAHLHGYLPLLVQEAHAPLSGRVHRAAQRAGRGHCVPTPPPHEGADREAAPLEGPDWLEQSPVGIALACLQQQDRQNLSVEV